MNKKFKMHVNELRISDTSDEKQEINNVHINTKLTVSHFVQIFTVTVANSRCKVSH